MYRHFLVPIDHTEDSVDLVVRAVNLAASMKARVTFLHTGQKLPGSLTSTSAREQQNDPRGVGQEVLAKAEAAARAWGVPSHAIAAGTGTDDAAAAIAEAARDQGCDLIMVASRGTQRRTAAPDVEGPLGVLRHSDLPVLFTATAPVASSVPAIGALREEHRLLATLLQAWGQVLDADEEASVSWMQSILAFIEQLETEHHPKERELFLKLRERTSTVDADLDEISRQHEREESMLVDLADQLQAVLSGPDAACRLAAQRSLAACVAAYTRFIWDHLGREEAVVLPAARRYLQEEDWAELEQAFSLSDSPDRTLESSRLLREIPDRASAPSPLTPGCSGGGHAA